MNSTDKVFVIRKYVLAKNVKEAITNERNYPVADAWLEENFQRQVIEGLVKGGSNTGFK